MSKQAEMQLLYRVANAPLSYFPFPHIFVEDVFPAAFYRRLREHLPPREHFKTLKQLGRVYGAYPDTRLVLPVSPAGIESLDEPYRGFWYDTGKWLLTGEFMNFVLFKFGSFVEDRFGKLEQHDFAHEAMLVQDYSSYELPPHTDSPKKVVSALFYLPEDESLSHHGTSIYLPKDRSKVSDGTAFENRADFDLAYTMPFKPNSLFAFVRTDDSFHGVQALDEPDVRRDLLLYDIKTDRPPKRQ
jgi:hypothetical protein